MIEKIIYEPVYNPIFKKFVVRIVDNKKGKSVVNPHFFVSEDLPNSFIDNIIRFEELKRKR